jgi:hypothetical protein
VVGLAYTAAKHYDIMQICFGSEKVLFVNSANYRQAGARSDPVEIRLADGGLTPATIVALFKTIRGVGGDMAVVQWFNITTDKHPIMLQPRCEIPRTDSEFSYGVVSIESISGHAHMIQDFDSPNRSAYWWDVVY